MRAFFTVVVLLACTFHALAQAPFIRWQKSLGGTADDYANCVIQTADTGYMVVGMVVSTNGDVTGHHGGSDGWVVKMSKTGSIMWKKCYGGTGADILNYVQQTTDGGYILAGYSGSTDGDVVGCHGIYDFWITKIDAAGGITWTKCLGGTGSDIANSIQQTTDGGYIVAGWSNSTDGDVTTNNGGWDYWIVKITATGAITWQKTFGSSADDVANSVAQTADGGYIVGGYNGANDGDVVGNHGGDDYWILKLTATGSLTWQISAGGSGDDDPGEDATPSSISQTSDGGYIVNGWSNSTDGDVTGNHGALDCWIVKLTAAGTIAWEKSLGGTLDDEATYMKPTSDGGYIMAGPVNSTNGDITGNHGAWDYFAAKLSATGTVQWKKCYGGSLEDDPSCIQQTIDGGYIMCGWSASSDSQVSGNHGRFDYWVVKLDTNYLSLEAPVTSTIPVSVLPNPTTGYVAVTGIEHADIQVYSLTGQLLKEAKHTDNITLRELPSGLYLLKIYDTNGQLVWNDKVMRQ